MVTVQTQQQAWTRDAHLCFICIDGYVMERGDVFALRVFYEKEEGKFELF